MAVDDSYRKFLLHMDGADGSTSFVDEGGHTVTAVGNAQIDTAQSKFGAASGLFDGSGDYLSVPDSDDWRLDGGSNANEWTIDFWIRFASSAGDHGFLSQEVDGNNFWRFIRNSSYGVIQFWQKQGGSNTINLGWTWSNAANTWYHVALVKQGTTGYKLFVDGIQIGSTLTDTTPLENFGAPLKVGNAVGYELNGWLDEVSISKGVARWTGNFTPPTAAYGPSGGDGVLFRRSFVGVGRVGSRSVI